MYTGITPTAIIQCFVDISMFFLVAVGLRIFPYENNGSDPRLRVVWDGWRRLGGVVGVLCPLCDHSGVPGTLGNSLTTQEVVDLTHIPIG